MGCVPAQVADELRRLLQLGRGLQAWMAVRWPYGKDKCSDKTATLSHLTRLLKVRHLPKVKFRPSFSPPFPQCGKCINAFISPRLPGILCTLLYLIVCKDLGGGCVFVIANLKKNVFETITNLQRSWECKGLIFLKHWNAHCSVWDGEASGGKFIFLNQEVVVRIKWVNVYKRQNNNPYPLLQLNMERKKITLNLVVLELEFSVAHGFQY